jgi:hypothetical protein
MNLQRWGTLCLLVIALFAVTIAVSAQSSLDAVTTSNAYLRAGPGTEWRRITVVPAGTTFRIDGRAPGDYWLRGITPNAEIGWIAIDVLSVTADQVAALPQIWVETPFTLSPPAGGVVPQQPAPQATALPAQDVPPLATAIPAAQSVNIAPVAVGSPITGFGYGGHVADWSTFASDSMRRAGMTWVKRQWRFFPGQNPGEVAGIINDAHARGFRIMLGIVGEANAVNTPGYFNTYAQFVGGVAALGADAIEVWNEMNIDREWQVGTISPQSYTQMLAAAYNAIKANNPNTMVISGAPAPTGFFGGCTGNGCDDNFYIQGMAAAGAANYMDCIGVHYNEGIVPPSQSSGDPRGNSSHYSRYYGSMVSTYYNAFGGSRPLCFTELGYLSPEGFGALPPGFEWAANTSVAEQAAWLDSVVSLARNSGRVRVMIIWNIDFANYGADPMAGFAIIRPGGGCPACDALGS